MKNFTEQSIIDEWYNAGYCAGYDGVMPQLDSGVADIYQSAFYDGLEAGLRVYTDYILDSY
jgi:hypothetical protein